MTEDEVVHALQAKAERGSSPLQLATLLDELTGGRLSQGILVTFFKRAFPALPLRVLLDAGAWHRVSDGGMSDDEFERLLGPYIGTT